jgi:hypothetical protein
MPPTHDRTGRDRTSSGDVNIAPGAKSTTRHERDMRLSEKPPRETVEDVMRELVRCAITPASDDNTNRALEYGRRLCELIAAAKAREGPLLLARKLRRGGALSDDERDFIARKLEGKTKNPNHRPKSWRSKFKWFKVAMDIIAAKATRPTEKQEALFVDIQKRHNVSRTYVFDVWKEIRQLSSEVGA